MVHRGPDDEGYHLSGSLGFGFRRLSIIDIDGGHQPMSDQEKSVWVIFNGEIYNFDDLRRKLEGYGHIFRTRSDTEVIIHGYKQWGNDVLNHLNGMFGLAIWDEKKRKLLLARDRMGIKIVYYKIEADTLFFGSEIRAVLAGVEKRPEVNPLALNLFLRYRYTPSPHTIFQGIKKLAPGTCLIIENGSQKLKRWWKFRPTPFESMPTVHQAKEKLLDLYKQAVKRQLVSDVPLGLLLSGGLDSGLLLALMNNYGKNWKTFTVGYGKDFSDDELTDAAQTAKILNVQNHSVKINRDIFETTLPKIISFLEEPIASSSIVPMFHVCEQAKKDVKVVLMGQGPDELFGGYKRHIGVRYGEYWRVLPNILRNPLKKMLTHLTRNDTIKRGLNALDTPDRLCRYQDVFSILKGQVIDSLFHNEILSQNPGDAIFNCWEDLYNLMDQTDELGGLQFLEIRSALPDELLMYADKLSMAHSLEVRVPYLDHDIVQYVERLAASFKVRYGTGKWLHKKVCKAFLPDTIIKRKKKGFAVNVVDKWFQESFSNHKNDFFQDNESLMYQYLRQDKITTLIEQHKNGYSDNHKILFSLTVFEKWLRQMNL